MSGSRTEQCGRLRLQPKRWVLVGDQREGVADDAVVPAKRALHEGEEAARVTAGEEDCEPGEYHREEDADREEEEDEVVGDGEQPLDQWEPSLEAFGVGVGEVE